MNGVSENQIAPCGMNCGVCVAYLREKNKCTGCNNNPEKISRYNCKIRNCKKRKGRYCLDCEEFPCNALLKLDKRYREKYSMSEIENLKTIKEEGIDKFLETQTKKYCSAKGTLCVHNGKRYSS